MAITPSSSSHLLSPPPFPASHAVDRPTQRHLRNLYLSLRRGQLRGSTQVALDTAKALRRVISGSRFTSMEDLSRTVRLTGAWLQDARKGGEFRKRASLTRSLIPIHTSPIDRTKYHKHHTPYTPSPSRRNRCSPGSRPFRRSIKSFNSPSYTSRSSTDWSIYNSLLH